MTALNRTYWLTEPCRIRRENDSVRIERPDNSPVRIPITDIRDIVAFDNIDINTSAVSLLGRYGVIVHVLDYYGNYAGSLSPTEDMSSATVIRRQVEISADSGNRLAIARDIVSTTAENIAWALDTNLLDSAGSTLQVQLSDCSTVDEVMGAEGNYRRTAWAVLDSMLPTWLRLDGRTRRPPTNAGNAFISYLNSITYARVLTALRCTPLHQGPGKVVHVV